MSDWIQSNWYELGSLLVQCAALAMLAWFGRGILGILAAAPGRTAHMERAITEDGAQARSQMPETAAESLPEPEAARPAREEAREEEPAPQYLRLPAVRFDIIGWLQEPMGGSGGVAPWRRVIRWLQTPIGS